MVFAFDISKFHMDLGVHCVNDISIFFSDLSFFSVRFFFSVSIR